MIKSLLTAYAKAISDGVNQVESNACRLLIIVKILIDSQCPNM